MPSRHELEGDVVHEPGEFCWVCGHEPEHGWLQPIWEDLRSTLSIMAPRQVKAIYRGCRRAGRAARSVLRNVLAIAAFPVALIALILGAALFIIVARCHAALYPEQDTVKRPDGHRL